MQSFYERFLLDITQVFDFATLEARRVGSVYIEPEHLLLGLTHDADLKANQLFALAPHAESFRKQLQVPIQTAQNAPTVELPLSSAAKRAVAYTVEEAHRVRSTPIGTEHLLLGLLRENHSTVPAFLATLGIDLHSARNRVRQDAGLPALEDEPGSEP